VGQFLGCALSGTLFAGERYIYFAKRITLPPKSLGDFLYLAVCFCVFRLLLVYAYVTGAVSPRVFALWAILLTLGLFIGLVYRLRTAHVTKGNQHSNRPLTNSVQVKLSIRKLRISIVVMVLLLLNGLWITRGQTLLPRLVGVAINLFITACFVFLIRKAKKAEAPD
jgi:hypothetical protein